MNTDCIQDTVKTINPPILVFISISPKGGY